MADPRNGSAAGPAPTTAAPAAPHHSKVAVGPWPFLAHRGFPPSAVCGLCPPAPGGGGGRSARESGLSDNGGGISSELHGRDAQTSSGDDTTMQPLSRIHSYSNMRPSGGEAVLGSLPIAISGGGALGTRQLSFSSGSRGMASELAVLAGLRQASQASLGRGSLISATAGDKQPTALPGLRVLSTTNEGSFVAVNSLMSSQSLTQKSITRRTPRRQNTDVDLDRLSGARDL